MSLLTRDLLAAQGVAQKSKTITAATLTVPNDPTYFYLMNSAAPQTVTVPALLDQWRNGTSIVFVQMGSAPVTIVPVTGVTFLSLGPVVSSGVNTMVALARIALDTYIVQSIPVGASLPASLVTQGTRNVSVPSAFPWNYSQLSFTIGLNGGVPVGAVASPQGLMPAAIWSAPLATQVFHVDQVNGLDTNTGIGAYFGDFSAAVKTVLKAVNLANATTIASVMVINAGIGPIFYRADTGVGTSVFPTVDLRIVSLGGWSTFLAGDRHTWTASDGTYPNCASAAETNTNGALDLLGTHLVGQTSVAGAAGVGTALVDFNGKTRTAYNEMTLYASPALLNAAPNGTWGFANDGTRVYARRGDGAIVSDANTRTFRGTAGGPGFSFSLNGATPKNFSATGIEFQGGQIVGNITATRNVWMDNCRATYSNLVGNGLDNGFMFDTGGSVLCTNCEAWSNGSDAFNPHASANPVSQWLNLNCIGWDNGRGTSQSNNGFTGHENAFVADVGGNYQMNRGGTCRMINNCRALLWGTLATGDLGDTQLGGSLVSTAIFANNNCTMWVGACTVSAQRALYAPDAGSEIIQFYPNTIVSGTITGNVVTSPV